jgi:uncharacterized membrane protein YjfL (UPF0719 family)
MIVKNLLKYIGLALAILGFIVFTGFNNEMIMEYIDNIIYILEYTILFIFVIVLYEKVTPYNVKKDILENNNPATMIAFGSYLFASLYLLMDINSSDSISYNVLENVLITTIYFLFTQLCLILIRFILVSISKLLSSNKSKNSNGLYHNSVNYEISNDKNVGMALMEASSYFWTTAFLVNYNFMSFGFQSFVEYSTIFIIFSISFLFLFFLFNAEKEVYKSLVDKNEPYVGLSFFGLTLSLFFLFNSSIANIAIEFANIDNFFNGLISLIIPILLSIVLTLYYMDVMIRFILNKMFGIKESYFVYMVLIVGYLNSIQFLSSIFN